MGWGKRLAGIALFLLVWEAVARSGIVPTEHVPTVPTIAAALGGLAASLKFLAELAATWGRALAGLALGIMLGLGAALLAGRYGVVRRMLEPVVEMLRVLPPPALVPLAIFALGLGPQLFLFIIGFAAVWPIYINAANALKSAEPVQLFTGRVFGYSDWEILLRLRLPSAMPEIFTGIRLAAGVSLLAAVAAEMLAGRDGLGFLLYDAAFTLRTADMFAIMFVVGVSGVLMNLLVAGARRIVIGWHVRLTALGEPA